MKRIFRANNKQQHKVMRANRFTAAKIAMAALAIAASALHAQSQPQPQPQTYIVRYDTVQAPDRKVFFDLYFPFDKAELRGDYLSNSESQTSLHTLLDTIAKDNLVSIDIVAQSSPEGVYEYNVTLSEKRSATMARYMERTYPELAGLFNIVPNGESWDKLREYVLADTCMTEASKKRITDVIDASISMPEKKSRMEKLGTDPNVGSIYRYIYRKYYKIIRYAGISVAVRDYTVVPVQIPVLPDTTAVGNEAADTVPAVQADTVPEQTVEYMKIPFMSVGTNLLYDAFFIPGHRYSPITNGDIELYFPRTDWSVLAELDIPWWSRDREHFYFQARNWQLEARRYFAPARNRKANGGAHTHTGHYLSLYGMYNLYDICTGRNMGHGIQGEGAGAGFGYGYVMPINADNRLKLEFFIKFGYYETHYDKYETGKPYTGTYYYIWDGDPEAFRARNLRFRWFGPTGAGITLKYDLMHKVRSDFYENPGMKHRTRQ